MLLQPVFFFNLKTNNMPWVISPLSASRENQSEVHPWDKLSLWGPLIMLDFRQLLLSTASNGIEGCPRRQRLAHQEWHERRLRPLGGPAFDQALLVQVEDGVGDDASSLLLVAPWRYHEDGEPPASGSPEHDLIPLHNALGEEDRGWGQCFKGPVCDSGKGCWYLSSMYG